MDDYRDVLTIKEAAEVLRLGTNAARAGRIPSLKLKGKIRVPKAALQRVLTTALENGGTIEKAQMIATHASPRTTKRFDRTRDQISLDEVERIAI